MSELSPQAQMLRECNDNLSEAQKLSIELTAAGWRQSDVAAEVKVTARTLQRWKLLPEYKEALAVAYREMGANVEERIKELVPLAFYKLREIIEKPDLKPSDWIAAIRLIVDVAGLKKVPQQLVPEAQEVGAADYIKLLEARSQQGNGSHVAN